MGDVAITVPVVALLRRNYPNAKITILTPAFFRPFFRDVEGVDFFTPDFKGRHKGKRGIWRLYRDLGHFDYIADMHDVIRTKALRLLSFLERGTVTAHIDKERKKKKRLTSLENKELVQLKTTAERYRDVLTRLGFDMSGDIVPSRKVYPLEAEVVELVDKRSGLWIGAAPFAQHRGKIYPVEKMTRVIEDLAGMPGARVFIFGGGAAEREYAEGVEKTTQGVCSVIGRVSLDKEIELISNLDVMVCMDSSAMHMASLCGLPVVSVWGATHPCAGFYGSGQRPEDAVQIDMPCRPCSIYGNKPCISGRYECLEDITPEMIVERVRRRLSDDNKL